MRPLPSATLRGLVFLVGALASACASTINYDYSREPDPRAHEFVIGPSDVVRVTVWKNADLSTEATVRPDGSITLPLLGDLQAVGRTPTQLRAAIAQRVSNFIKNDTAPVTVALVSVNSYRYTLSGNFERPGVFSSHYYVTLAEAIALAGGLNRFANPHRLVLVRRGDKGVRRIPVDFERVSSGEHPEEDLALMTGDVLFAP